MLGLYLMTAKGLAVFQQLLKKYGKERIAYVVTMPDTATEYDGHSDIISLAHNAGIQTYSKSEAPAQHARYLMAVSWRWLIKTKSDQRLIVFHDSLLPRYRGFAPLVAALINGEETIGVTALFASENYDGGPLIGQAATHISYPITISEAITQILPCYEKLAVEVMHKLFQNKVDSRPQDESLASYCLWRDDKDYFIDWTWEANRIQRFVDAVGFPYKGAATVVDGALYRIRECRALPEVNIENRTVGKVIFSTKGYPVVVCGHGLLEIQRMTVDGSEANALPLSRFRTRFCGQGKF